jgi:hypothetical protein
MQTKSGVLHFIEEGRKKGKTDKQIKSQLLDAGWQIDVVNHAMEGKPHDHPVSAHTPIQSSRLSMMLHHPAFIAVAFLVLTVLAVVFI